MAVAVYEYKLTLSKNTAFMIQEQVGNSENIAKITHQLMKHFYEDKDREIFTVLFVNSKLKVIGFNIVSIGSLNQSVVHPREVFKPAILANAANIILCHNHPSGDPVPSLDDKHITQRLIEAGKLLGIEVIDHVIIGDDNYCSMRESTKIKF